MDNAFYLFGGNAFSKANYVNKSLFLGISKVLCDITPQRLREKDKDRIARQMQAENKLSFTGGIEEPCRNF